MPDTDDGVWAEPHKVLWNYLVVIGSSSDLSHLTVYKYADKKPAMLPELSIKERGTWTPGITQLQSQYQARHDGEDHDSGDEDRPEEPPGANDSEATLEAMLTDYVKKLIAYAEGQIPDVQIARTPLFLHATGDVTNLSRKDKHALLRKTCEALQKNSKFILNDCSKQVYDIDGRTEALLGWLSVNYQLEGTLTEDGFVEINPYSLQRAYIAGDGRKSAYERLSLGLGNGTNIHLDMDVDTIDIGYEHAWRQYLDSLDSDEPSAPCVPLGYTLGLQDGTNRGLEGTGNREQCIEQVKSLMEPITPLTEVPAKFLAAGGFNEVYNELFQKSPELITKFCETPWQELQQSGQWSKFDTGTLAQMCFRATLTEKVLEVLFLDPKNDQKVDYIDSVHDLDYRWSDGRALIYAASEVSAAKEPSGVQPNVGGTGWSYGVIAGTKRPQLGKGDSVARFDKLSHRVYGAGVFLIILIGAVYFLLGKSRRAHIWASLQRRRRGYTTLDADEFEIEEPEEFGVGR